MSSKRVYTSHKYYDSINIFFYVGIYKRSMATTENTLRTRQNMEILDVWKNLSSQVNALTKRQVAVFPDTLKPKTQRDMEVEVNVDKSVESLNSALEARLANLEFVLKNDAQLGAMARTVAPRPRPEAPVEAKEPQPPPLPILEPSVERMTKDERKITDRRNAEVIRQYEERLRQYEERVQKMREEALRSRAGRAEAERKIEERIRGEQKESIRLLPFQNSYQDVINTGSIVSLWNNIVRYYQKQGLSRQSQEMVKVKVQDLIPNLEAIVYGLGQAVDVLFATNKYTEQVGLKILELLRTQSVYQLIKRQIDTTSFEVVSVSALETAFKNIFAELSEERRELLDELTNRDTGSIATRPIRKIPQFSSTNFRERLRALGDEMGIDVSAIDPDLEDRLKRMNQKDFERYAVEALQSVRQEKNILSLKQSELISNATKTSIALGRIISQISDTARKIAMKKSMINIIDGDEIKQPPPDEPTEDLGDEPLPPDPEDYFETVLNEDGEEEIIWNENREEADWDSANREFNDALAEYRRKKAKNESILEQNRLNAIALADKATQEEEKANLVREIRELEDSIPRLELKERRIQEQLLQRQEVIDTFLSLGVAEAYGNALGDLVDAYAGKLQKTTGKDKSIVSRGLAGMGSHYGAEDDSEEEDSESESDEEDRPFDFDDRRNDSYYSRPARRR